MDVKNDWNRWCSGCAWCYARTSAFEFVTDLQRIVLYKNGFIVNDGPLRSYLDPANESFLKNLERGYDIMIAMSHNEALSHQNCHRMVLQLTLIWKIEEGSYINHLNKQHRQRLWHFLVKVKHYGMFRKAFNFHVFISCGFWCILLFVHG